MSRWLQGADPRGDKRDAICALAAASGLIDEPGNSAVPIMGYVGAGAEIDPEYEQVPADGLDQAALPFALPEDMIGFQARGDSMLPKYDDGDVVVVHRDQQRSTESLIGEEAAVRTEGGHRYLKRIMPGPKPRTFNLESTNARTIVGAAIVWASEIWVIVPGGRLGKIERQKRGADRRRNK